MRAYDPDLVVIFSPDHYNGFFYRAMPPFCIGMYASAVGDYGTHIGALDVPTDLAADCAKAVLGADVDVAVWPAWTWTTGPCSRWKSCSEPRPPAR
ncbi:3-carboxyethylcatechol 2,3-dioxygenase [Mycobacterium sp. 012931]|nr:3-carboxyethylcatechol 2,3-dioxygenase [Mycobacterium sp. 012931]MBC9864376.1 3-carboxyethylcatechol 2,3-dioxygenase [Mycobacterium pseudoshottsii]